MKADLGVQITEVTFRAATAQDIEAIAALHADSWRRHYRGAYSDQFLDGDVFADRSAVWTDRLTNPRPSEITVIAENGGVPVGFAHTILDNDPTWGALLDNLHVRHDLKGQGIGTRLMAETARVVLDRTTSSGLYLWVLEQNEAAQAFYASLGGRCVGSEVTEPAGGGKVVGLRFAWLDPSSLLAPEGQ